MEGAVKHFSCLWVASLVCAVTAAGCGLVLDTQPRSSRLDAGPEEDGGQQDGDLIECVIDDECQNGNVCDGRETCVDSRCVGTDTIMNCRDAFACTVDECDPQLGCTFTPDDTLCDDGICFENEGCATKPCENPGDCGRADACVGLFTCDEQVCQRAAPLVCENDGCLVGACRNSTCVYIPDSSRCPGDGTCLESTCQTNGECSRVPNDELCDDGVECTIDSCLTLSLSGFCEHMPDHTFCDDGVECTYNFCAPDDPSVDVVEGDGCAMRLIDSFCAEAGGFTGCVSPVCLPTGCGDGVTVHPCDEGGICNVDTGECEVPQGCDACADLDNLCAPTACEPNQQLCLASTMDPCATTLPGFIGYCETSNGDPHCEVRRNPQTLPPISIGLPAPVLP